MVQIDCIVCYTAPGSFAQKFIYPGIDQTSFKPLYSYIQPTDTNKIFKENISKDTFKTWQQLQTVEDVCLAYPERMISLLKAINLNPDRLKEVKVAYDRGNISLACTLLLEYYKKGNTAQYLRKNFISFSKSRDKEADSILQNIFTFYNQPAKVPPVTPHDALNLRSDMMF